jgi:hypothetical protein
MFHSKYGNKVYERTNERFRNYTTFPKKSREAQFKEVLHWSQFYGLVVTVYTTCFLTIITLRVADSLFMLSFVSQNGGEYFPKQDGKTFTTMMWLIFSQVGTEFCSPSLKGKKQFYETGVFVHTSHVIFNF